MSFNETFDDCRCAGRRDNFFATADGSRVRLIRTYSDGAKFAATLKMVGRMVQYLDYESLRHAD